jgi:hypothetical protein
MVKAENWRFWQLILKLDGEGGELKILAIDTETGCHHFCRITLQSFLLFPAHSAHSEGESSRYCWWIDNISYVSTNAMRLVPINPTTSRVSSHTILLPLLILDWLLRVPLSGCFTYWTVKCCCPISREHSQTSSLSWRDVRLPIRWECLATNARFKRAGQFTVVNPSCVQVQLVDQRNRCSTRVLLAPPAPM